MLVINYSQRYKLIKSYIMKNIKRITIGFLSMVILIVSLLVLTGCSNEEDHITATKIEIKKLEYGGENGNAKELAAGEDLHIDAEIYAEATIYSVTVEMHAAKETTANWKFEKEFKGEKYTLKKNIDFHEHIEISKEAKEGAYHFHIAVKDALGNVKRKEGEFLIVEKSN
ncbi:hypothetical protein TM902_540077 [Tenacibaculum maritimum]|uniref:Uncharacterized protein n=2 Tax=Tenacibaculum maritimum TaxID=107401 RepID=A0A2H1E8Z7_9FLAO|nr:hypothetical protein B9C57_03675 [Tenacibaculum maritimum]SFZ81242.1 protein of unknown function [Tenacibaculum maritimum NCIMB 2154]CAA0150530.1 hypothetical protein NCIMB2158_10143 [Tenacibaculum maritimum]CAA0156490.1 hypothetical protein JIP32914_100006 [Tenacibaculum maritimum]CAA0191242.1 hypothetical protein TM902_540077 [Tenacibaculum maritimum]